MLHARISACFIFIIYALIGCTDKQTPTEGQKLLDSSHFKIAEQSINSHAAANEVSYYRFAESDSLLLIWNATSAKVSLLTYPNFEIFQEYDLDTISSLSPIVDVHWHNGKLYMVGLHNEVNVYHAETGYRHAIKLDSALAGLDLRAFSISHFPLYVEDSTMYFVANTTLNINYLAGMQEQELFFSAPLEIAYDTKSASVHAFGAYPLSYRKDEIQFYNWLPHRKRLSGRSIYSFAHVDSLYLAGHTQSNAGAMAVPRSSVLRGRKLQPFDKSRMSDYAYIRDYGFVNDRYTELITDPYRNLVYSVFVPGVDVPDDRRLRPEHIAFTVMVFNAEMEFQKEVFFPAGAYDHRFHFVTPEGLYLLTASSVGQATQQFHGFDLAREGGAGELLPQNLILKVTLPPLAKYMREDIGIATSVDTVVVISGLGCKGCLESMVKEAETKGRALGNYAYVATPEAARSQSIADLISRRQLGYIDERGLLGDYRLIGDFLTLLVFQGDSIVVADGKFAF